MPPSVLQGKWSEEETQHLVKLVEAKGRKWKAIGEEIGRLAMACRDRYRELKTSGANHNKGAWTEEECEQLQAAVQDHLRTKQVGVVVLVMQEDLGEIYFQCSHYFK